MIMRKNQRSVDRELARMLPRTTAEAKITKINKSERNTIKNLKNIFPPYIAKFINNLLDSVVCLSFYFI